MELRQAEALGLLDHHQRGIGHIDADFNHGRRDEQLRPAPGKAFHGGILDRRLELPVDEHHHIAEAGLERGEARFGGGSVSGISRGEGRA